ncbi:hypothetical protein LZ11_00878 [Thermosediminibacter litoriperuensis]|uniref:Uncharacterized protein n=1 Tax=Thermosediminibacter litoriperuensis TaxID=291989 RepID=A0A5S5AWQ5_9FIRM|nr:hypothetical protein LZ11_00878 [Thermosediminibacter litoriperuensis]
MAKGYLKIFQIGGYLKIFQIVSVNFSVGYLKIFQNTNRRIYKQKNI